MLPSILKNQMANDGKGVRLDGQLFLGAGAEPLSTSRLSVGHQMFDRPVEISERLEEIGTADGGRKRQAVEETRSGYIDDGSALILINPGSDGGLRSVFNNNRDSPRPA